MTKRERAEPGTPIWVDVQTPDIAAAKAFYGKLLGWTFVDSGDGTVIFYTTAMKAGRKVAGMAKIFEGSPFAPAWTVYLATEDAARTAEQVVAAGGRVVLPADDVMDQGRMAYLADPAGALFGVWQPKQHHGAELVDETSTMVWHEVYSRDLDAARTFYQTVFGLEGRKLDAPGIDYWTLRKNGKTVCGTMQMTAAFPAHQPSHWNTYFAVENADAAAEKVTGLGGKVRQPPFDTPYGRMTAVADPAGAPFCLIEPKGSSTTW